MSSSSHSRKKRSRSSGSPTLDDCNEAVREALEERIRTLQISLDDADRTVAALRQERDTATQQKLQTEHNIDGVRARLYPKQQCFGKINLRYADITYRVQLIDPDWPIPPRGGQNARDPTNAEIQRFLGIP